MEIVFLSQWVKVQLSIKLFVGQHFLNYLFVLFFFYEVGWNPGEHHMLLRDTAVLCAAWEAHVTLLNTNKFFPRHFQEGWD